VGRKGDGDITSTDLEEKNIITARETRGQERWLRRRPRSRVVRSETTSSSNTNSFERSEVGTTIWREDETLEETIIAGDPWERSTTIRRTTRSHGRRPAETPFGGLDDDGDNRLPLSPQPIV